MCDFSFWLKVLGAVNSKCNHVLYCDLAHVLPFHTSLTPLTTKFTKSESESEIRGKDEVKGIARIAKPAQHNRPGKSSLNVNHVFPL